MATRIEDGNRFRVERGSERTQVDRSNQLQLRPQRSGTTVRRFPIKQVPVLVNVNGLERSK